MININLFQTYFRSSKPGLYAQFIKDKDCLYKIFKPEFCDKIIRQMEMYNCENCIYIGKETGKLYSRVEGKHTNGKIRYSTLRYTISYCAGMDRYKIKGISVSRKRKLKKSDEEKITNWIKENTYFKIIETNDYNSLECQYIKKYCPPLNIKGNPNSILTTGERAQSFIELSECEFNILE